ncbi:variable large family protein [Borreliella yangtzensis]|uniref:Variable large protein n=1 Tax=Borreliella yangtzensis TaxID=683292 RepID=A0ABR6PAR1_9SPIR|nr:hypothetical protein [Borreliella yangtzensis]MBB6043362.1 hypothetical protein [Borreliella yangtzensis]
MANATGAAKGGAGDGIEGAINEINGWLEEMVTAAKAAAAAANGGGNAIGDVVKAEDGAAAKGGDKESVNGIANGIKGIVDAAGKAGDEGKLKDVEAGGKEDNKDAGKLFVKKAGDVGGADEAGKAAAAAAAVSGEQILKAIVDAAKDGAEKKGVKAADAENPIAAAIGSTANDAEAKAFEKDGMKKDDQIAAAMVLLLVVLTQLGIKQQVVIRRVLMGLLMG